MHLSIKIDQDEKHLFFSLYDKLSSLEKKIWQLAVWWVKRFPCACPKQQKIADKLGCRREHVNRTFKKFKESGWLYLTSRGAKRTKILGIPTHLISIDVIKREYFKRIEITSERTHSYSSYKKSTSRKTGTLDVPIYLQKLKISLDSKLKLSLVPESIYQSALESARKDHKKGKIFRNEETYVVGTAINMAKKQGIKLEWKKYYQCYHKDR